MSTILNALKKLENETSPGESLLYPGAMRDRKRSSTGYLRLLKGSIFLCIAVIGVVGIVYWGSVKWIEKAESQHMPALAPEIIESKSASHQSQPLDRHKGITGAPRVPAASILDLPKKQAIVTDGIQRPASHNVKQTENSEKSTIHRTNVRTDPNAYSSHQSTQLVPPATNPVKANQKKTLLPSLPTRDPYEHAVWIRDDLLQLQAISWSDLPKARITIINGRILHEGQSVEGYTVIQIRPDNVVLDKAETYWKLEYNSR